MLFVIFGVPVGALVALQRFPVFSLAPVVALFAAGAIVTGIATGHDPRAIVIEVLGAIASPQLAYPPVSRSISFSPRGCCQRCKQRLGKSLARHSKYPAVFRRRWRLS